jgi:hypothetical protein
LWGQLVTNLEVPHRELNLSFVKNLDSNKHWLHFWATEMGRWQFGHHFGTKNLTTSTVCSSLWSLSADICCSLRSRSSDPLIDPLNLWSFHSLLWKIAIFIAKFSTNGPWLP